MAATTIRIPKVITTNDDNKDSRKVGQLGIALKLMAKTRRRKSTSSRTLIIEDGSTRSSTVSSVVSPQQEEDTELPTRKGCLKYRTQEQSLNDSRKQSPPTTLSTVSWSNVTVHSHAIELCDNPAVSSGPPISIGWKAFDTTTLPLDEYETAKPPPRDKNQMIVPRFVREDWLREQGYSRRDITEAVKEISKVKANRNQSASDGLLKERLLHFLTLSRGNSTTTKLRTAATDAAVL